MVKIRVRFSLVVRFDYFSGKYIRADTGGCNGIDDCFRVNTFMN